MLHICYTWYVIICFHSTTTPAHTKERTVPAASKTKNLFDSDSEDDIKAPSTNTTSQQPK